MAFFAAAPCRARTHLASSADCYSLLPLKFDRITPPCHLNPKRHSVFCTLSKQTMAEHHLEPVVLQRPDSFGRFGKFGGKYVPETLMYALTELETAFNSLASDQKFQVLLKDPFFSFFLFAKYIFNSHFVFLWIILWFSIFFNFLWILILKSIL